MYEQQLVIDDDSNSERRSKVHQLVMLTSCNGNSQFASRTSPYRTLCILTAGLAFILGLVVGVMIPLYVLPRSVSSSRLNVNSSRPTDSQRRNYTKAATEFPTVSFVANSAAPVAVVRPSVDAGGLLQGGVYWGRRVEDAMPAGFEESEAESWRRFARKTPVVKVEEGCGRMQNRLLTFEGGTRSCCRYRQNTDQIQGELFSFYLGRLLGLRNLAPSSLALVRLRDPLWSRVRPQLSLAQWNEEQIGRAHV
jgi:four-jointed box protein 1